MTRWLFANNEPLKFEPGLLVFYILSMLIMLATLVLGVGFYLNSKWKFFNGPKLKFSGIALLSTVMLIFLVMGLLTTIMSSSSNYFKNNYFVIYMSWILLGLASLLLIGYIVTIKITSKNKHQVGNFMEEDFTSLLQQVETRLSQKDCTDKLKKNHTRYFSALEQKSQFIQTMIDSYRPELFNNILIDIVMFNETSTTRWSSHYNDVQLKILLTLCVKFQQKVRSITK